MDDKKLEKRLGEFDFSSLSPVREPLLQKLLFLKRSQKAIAGESNNLWEKRIDDEALDCAAGGAIPQPLKKQEVKK